MSKQYRPQPPQLPTDTQTLLGNQLPVLSQVPKGIQEYPVSGVKRAIQGDQHLVHCPFEGKWVDGDPIVDPPEGPRVTNQDGATTYACPSCKKILATVGNSMYNTGIGQNANPSSNSRRVAPRS
jgi:hypothetical protein